MPNLGLGTALSSSGLITPGVVTSNLVMKHMYPAGGVKTLSDGAAYFLDGTDPHIQLPSAFNVAVVFQLSLNVTVFPVEA